LLQLKKQTIIWTFSPNSVAPHCRTWDPGGRVGSRYKGWRWV